MTFGARIADRNAALAEMRQREAADADAAIATDVKAEAKRVLGAAAKMGNAAYKLACALLYEMPEDELLAACRVATEESETVHQSGGRAVVSTREATRDAETAWLKTSRLEAEKACARMFPASAPQINPHTLSGEQIALTGSFGRIAHEAAGLNYVDGQKRYRGDETDAGLFQRGEESARKIWSGR
jgi:hypothetical protein